MSSPRASALRPSAQRSRRSVTPRHAHRYVCQTPGGAGTHTGVTRCRARVALADGCCVARYVDGGSRLAAVGFAEFERLVAPFRERSAPATERTGNESLAATLVTTGRMRGAQLDWVAPDRDGIGEGGPGQGYHGRNSRRQRWYEPGHRDQCGQYEHPDRPSPGYPREDGVLHSHPTGQEQGGSAENDKAPGRRRSPQRAGDDEFVADRGDHQTRDHGHVDVRQPTAQAGRRGERRQGRGEQPAGGVEVDAEHQRGGGDRRRERRRPPRCQAVGAERLPTYHDQPTERDDEELPVTFGVM